MIYTVYIYIKCIAILFDNLVVHISIQKTFSPARFCLFTLEALKKSVEQRQELDDAIDQCEQASPGINRWPTLRGDDGLE